MPDPIVDLAEGGRYDRIIGDTASAGGLPVAALPLETGKLRGREALRRMGEALSRQLGL